MDLKGTGWEHNMTFNLFKLLTSGKFLRICNGASGAIKGREFPWTNECVCNFHALLRQCEHYTFVQWPYVHYMFVLWVSALCVFAVTVWAIRCWCCDILSITCLCCNSGHSHSCVAEHSSFLGRYAVPLAMQVPVFERTVVPSRHQELHTLWHRISQKTLIFTVAHLKSYTNEITASQSVSEWTSLKNHCLPIMCNLCLFLYFSVYSTYTSCFTRFQFHNLHSTSSDEHSLINHGTDDCPGCMCETVCKETWGIPEITKRFWLYKVSVKGAHLLKFASKCQFHQIHRLCEHFLRNI
jgi:hypothetical protein